MSSLDATPANYGALLADVKAAVTAARTQATRAVNTELVTLYWRIGRLILDRQQSEGWGTRVIDRLSADLRSEFPGMRGFSARSLKYMRAFAAAYPDSIVQEPPAQLPWSHIMVLLDKVADPDARAWYAEQDVRHGWSAAVLAHHVSTDRYARIGAAPSTFPQAMTPAETDQARELLQDPYVLDFLALDPHHSERDLEDAIVARLTRFLTELGTGFAFVGRQYRLAVGGREYFLDLLCYNLRLRRFVIFELKAGAAEAEHVGKLNFYVNVVDDQLRDREHGDQPTIGILLAAGRDDVVVEYALRGLATPLAVSTYRALPDDIRPALPSTADLQQLVRQARREFDDKPAEPA
jgi:predicted nuclease of restriction endonuclease-like (RecB) superfamily